MTEPNGSVFQGQTKPEKKHSLAISLAVAGAGEKIFKHPYFFWTG